MSVFQRIYTHDKIRDKKTRKLIKTTQERYKNVETGKIVTRRQRDAAVKVIPRLVRKSLKNQNNSLLKSFIEKQKEKTGKKMTLRQANLSDKYTSVVKKLRRGAKLKREGLDDTGEDGRDYQKVAKGNKLIREALEETTRRDKISPEIIPGESA